MNKRHIIFLVIILTILVVGLVGCNDDDSIYYQREYWVGTYTFEKEVTFLSTNNKIIYDKENTIKVYIELRDDGSYRLLEKVNDKDLLVTLVDNTGTWELVREPSAGYCIYMYTGFNYINKIYISKDGNLTFAGDSYFHEDKCGIDIIQR